MSFLSLQTALFQRLDNDATLGALISGVFDYVPQDYDAFPYVVLGENIFSEFDTDSDNGHTVSVTIHTWSRFKGKEEALVIQDAIYNLLHHAEFAISGFNLVNIYQETQTVLRDPDGITQHGIQTFSINLQRV